MLVEALRLGVPVGVPIREFIAHIARRDFANAYAAVKDANALPAICGRVCPRSLVRGRVHARPQGRRAGGHRTARRFIADWAADAGPRQNAALDARRAARRAGTLDGEDELTPRGGGRAAHRARTDLSGKRVAVVGSGPASLTCAGELAKFGGGRHGVRGSPRGRRRSDVRHPEFRLLKSLVAREVAAIEALGVKFEVNAVVGKPFDVEELLGEHGFDAVFVATGAGLPSYMGIEGEGPQRRVCVANELLTRVNLMKGYRFPEYETPVFKGKRCVVVGGDVAMDAARTARPARRQVTVVYRRGREEMPARSGDPPCRGGGVVFKTLTNPVKLIGDDVGWLVGAEVVDMELGEPDEGGRSAPHAKAGSNHVIACDMFVISIGNKTNPLIARTTPPRDDEPQPHRGRRGDVRDVGAGRLRGRRRREQGRRRSSWRWAPGKRAAAGIASYLTPGQLAAIPKNDVGTAMVACPPRRPQRAAARAELAGSAAAKPFRGRSLGGGVSAQEAFDEDALRAAFDAGGRRRRDRASRVPSRGRWGRDMGVCARIVRRGGVRRKLLAPSTPSLT